MDNAHIVDNAAELTRLKQLVGRLTDAQLMHPMPDGWTVAGVLAHAAFWDARALVLLDKWLAGGKFTESDIEPEDVTWINDSAKVLCLALPPRAAAELAVKVAEEIDGKIAALTDAQVAQILADQFPSNLSRWEHRREHIDEIESALS